MGALPRTGLGADVRLIDVLHRQSYRIVRLDGPELDCRRLLDLGLTPGEAIAVVQATPLGDPLIVAIRGTRLALRRREAAWIWVQ
jgi:Fe2+ transport system protein FeoA